ncbi:MAG: putative transporter, substrate-binding protein [Microbacteriaceae bacterium]|jgi:basic membrane protein A|nr:putative transporter, substrate-binding protein [Microbacteriaceae bacterium]
MRISTSIRSLAVLGAALVVLSGCASAPEKTAAPTASNFCARMVTNSGGLQDRSFNQASWAGLQSAEKSLNISAKVLVSNAETDLEPNVEQAVASGCKFVLTVGYELTPAVTKAAKANPDTDFSIVDDTVDAPNIKPIVFDTAQAAYLAGYLAAGVSKTGKVATFGGGNQPPVTLFMDGFVDGVAHYNEVHGTKVQAIGWSKQKQDGLFTGDFEDTGKGLTVTQGLIDQGADVILPVAGQVGEGAAAAALQAGNVSLIWVDSDGYETLPAEYRPILLTSVEKRTGDAVVKIVGESKKNTFTNTPFVGTLKNGGVDISGYHDMASKVSPALQAEVKKLKADIVAGTIRVTSPSAPK